MCRTTTALLLSGGLDSAVLLAHLLGQKHQVQPLFVRCGLIWEEAELAATRRLLKAMGTRSLSRNLLPLIVLEQPVADLYGPHWSLTGRGVPGADTPDEAMYLPGRNLLLLTKAALWCQLHGVQRLALGVLGPNPFADASQAFFDALQRAVQLAGGAPLELLRPFGNLTKDQVLKLADGVPLELTFSCADPQEGLHCGRCNKCHERREVFRRLGREDPTVYAHSPS